jgi:hypothetical protein
MRRSERPLSQSSGMPLVHVEARADAFNVLHTFLTMLSLVSGVGTMWHRDR